MQNQIITILSIAVFHADGKQNHSNKRLNTKY